MIRFTEIEALGAAFAGMTEKADGDFSNDALRVHGLLGAVAGDAEDIVLLRQVHGASVVHAAAARSSETAGVIDPDELPEGDAIVSNVPGLAIAVRVADCVPIMLFDPRRRVAAVVHAGREGTYRGVAASAIAALTELGAHPPAVHAVLGPSAGPCCYEVSSELARKFQDKGLPASGRHLDLWEANARQLTAAGLEPTNIHSYATCTICSSRFHSYRASKGSKSNNMAIIVI